MQSKLNEAKTLSKNAKMDDLVFREIEAKALIDADKPQEIVKEYLNVKKPKLPLKFIAELFIEKNNKEYAVETIKKMTDPEEQVRLLI